ncbi:pneumococcal serine-rich repeat protein-like [Pecten maximus]|uniref:pneumococcal serine-rich repeat protein-like n=1 Tax=Pecten maximus TaxID=6579 RepID=UPI0014580EDA|nr:pneumococcal serine-rich repeat protein-like [Pecten maximus]
MPLLMDLLISPEQMNWESARVYCEERNGLLINLDSQEKWDYFTAHDQYRESHVFARRFWIGVRFSDDSTCNGTGEYRSWVFDGWGRWFGENSEPYDCPHFRCVQLIYGWMMTFSCSDQSRALCEIELLNATETSKTTHAQYIYTISQTEGEGTESAPPITYRKSESEVSLPVSTTTCTPGRTIFGSMDSSILLGTIKPGSSSSVSTTASTSGRTIVGSMDSSTYFGTLKPVASSSVPTTASTPGINIVGSMDSSTDFGTLKHVASSLASTTASTSWRTIVGSMDSSTDFGTLKPVASSLASTTASTSGINIVGSMDSSSDLSTSEPDASSVSSMLLTVAEGSVTSSVPKPSTLTPSMTSLTPSDEEENTTCGKCCSREIKPRTFDQGEVEEILRMLKTELAVNKTNLSSQRRKLISVYDSRPSSAAMGGLACSILATLVGVIVVPDAVALGRFVYKRFNTQHKTLII